MHLDASDLKSFYYRTALGRAAQKAVRGRLGEFWPEAKGLTVAGYGFAAPLLRPYLAEARRVMALMPAPQGVMPWPMGEPNVSALVEEALWPIETGHLDRLVMLHGLETSETPSEVLAEAHRTLGPGGKLTVCVPNRAGLWSRRDVTPFGYGRPYTLGQIEAQLERAGFEPRRHAACLFQPPSHRPFWLRSGDLMEKMGRSLPTRFAGGVLLVEAGKTHPAPTRPGLAERVRARAPAMAPLGAEPARRAPRPYRCAL